MPPRRPNDEDSRRKGGARPTFIDLPIEPPAGDDLLGLVVVFSLSRGAIIDLELLDFDQEVRVERMKTGANAFHLSWPTATSSTAKRPKLRVSYGGERPSLLAEHWVEQGGPVAGDLIADEPPTMRSALGERLDDFKQLLQDKGFDDGELHKILKSFGPWPGRGRRISTTLTDRGFQIYGEWRDGVNPAVIEEEIADPDDGEREDVSNTPSVELYYMPAAMQIADQGASEFEVEAGYFLILDILSLDEVELRAEFGLGPPGPLVREAASEREYITRVLQARVIARAKREAGVPDNGIDMSLEGQQVGVAYFSTLQRDLVEWYFGPLGNAEVLARYQRAFARFANGNLRKALPIRKFHDDALTQPNSAFYLFFAEFAAAAVKHRMDVDYWMHGLPIQIESQRAFMSAYAPRGSGELSYLLFRNYVSLNYEESCSVPIDEIIADAERWAGKPLEALEGEMDKLCFKALRNEAVPADVTALS